MKGDPRAWWWAGVLIAGICCALFSVPGIAGADVGDSSGVTGSQQSHSPAKAKHRAVGTVGRAQHLQTARSDSAALRPMTSNPIGPINTVTGVKVGHSDLVIPNGSDSYSAAADWYFPTQANGSVAANGVIWLQHGFLADKSFYSTLATQLARQTNSIVIAPNLPSFVPAPIKQAVAALFLGDQPALNASAIAAGYQGTLPEQFILTGHSAGGGFAVSVAGFTADNGAANNGRLRGVVMFDGVSTTDAMTVALNSLGSLGTSVYQIAAPPQLWNIFGATTNQLLSLRPDKFDGVVLVGGSHVDSMLGSNPIIDTLAQLVAGFSPTGATAATYTLSAGWINDMYVGAGPDDPQFGFYNSAGASIVMGEATAVALDSAHAYIATRPSESNGATGVQVRQSSLTIPCESGYVASTNWYLPTQADGSVQANGVIWMQHGLLGDNAVFAALARELAQRTNSIVVAPTITSLPLLCSGCWIDGVAMSRAIAELFIGDREALNTSANAAGYLGTLPQRYILTGHSIGGGIAAAAGGFSVGNGAANGDLLGVVMFDGVSLMMDGTTLVDTFANAMASLDTLDIPVYQLAAPPQTWNNLSFTTNQLAALRPGKFVGVGLLNGSHSDAILDSISSLRYLLLIHTPSPKGNTAAVYALASGWINDMYIGAGPDDPLFGIYGGAGQPITMGIATAIAA